MLEKLPGVASADADKTTKSATIIYDKSVFDTSSLGDEGRYQFELRDDSAASGGSQAKEETDGYDSMIKIQDAPAGEGSDDKSNSGIVPSFDGPAS